MLLAFDVGNTTISIGIFDKEKLLATWRLASDARRLPDEYAVLLSELFHRKGISFKDIEGVVIGSVVPPLTSTFEELSRKYLGREPLVVGAGVRTGIRIRVHNPREVGADRVANSVAGFRLYGGPLIIVDFGTATTFDVVSGEGDYLGGLIAPGIRVAAEALFRATAMLPRVELSFPKQIIGRNTVDAIRSGLLYGYLGLVEGVVRRVKEEIGGEPRVIATGGDAPLIAGKTDLINHVEPDLTLIGLRFIYELNARGWEK